MATQIEGLSQRILEYAVMLAAIATIAMALQALITRG